MFLTRRNVIQLGTFLAATATLPTGNAVAAPPTPNPGFSGSSRRSQSAGNDNLLYPNTEPDVIEATRDAISYALGDDPYAGGALSAIFGLLWPAPQADVWDTIKQRVEELVKKEIAQFEYSLIKTELNGLRGALASYLLRVKNGASGTEIRNYYSACDVVFEDVLPKIKNPDYAYLNLVFFSIAANLHLTLLRDGVKYGRDWGMSPTDYDLTCQTLRQRIKDYTDYIDTTISDERDRLKDNEPTGDQQDYAALWNYWQPFEADATQLGLDFKVLMPFMDPQKYPNGVPRSQVPFHDIFSPAYGSAEGWDNCRNDLAYQVEPIYRTPLAGIDRFEVTATGDTHTVNTCYAPGSGPVTASYNRAGRLISEGTQRFAKTSILASQPSYGEPLRTIQIPKPPAGRRHVIESAVLSYGDIVQQCSLTLIDGTNIDLWRGDPARNSARVAVKGRFLSTLTMWTRNPRYNNVPGNMIFGFSVDPEYIPPEITNLVKLTAPKPAGGNVSRKLSAARDEFWDNVAESSK